MIDLPAYDPQHWQNDARCFQLKTDPDVMQPEKATRAEVAAAKAICGSCEVRDQCRAHAESQEPSAYGIHGGEWFGDDPVWMVDRECDHCGTTFRGFEKRTQTRYCSRAHAQAALRARAAAVVA